MAVRLLRGAGRLRLQARPVLVAAEASEFRGAEGVLPHPKAAAEAAEAAQSHVQQQLQHREVGGVALAGQHVGADQGTAPKPEPNTYENVII